MPQIRIGLVGVGKIARDQHLPAIAANPAFRLVAVADRRPVDVGAPFFGSIEEMLAGAPDLDAVALCTPPQVRRQMAVTALAAGKHVLLEKPPASTLGEAEALIARGQAAGVTLFATWHARFAGGVEAARTWLASRRIRSVEIAWKEDVRRWHPGQAWIWEAGGMGVFDPGINALSILTHILPEAPFLVSADLEVPQNRQSPIAAKLALATLQGAQISADFDWRQTGPQLWDIGVEADDGALRLSQGGARLEIAGKVVHEGGDVEYPGIYARFAELIAERRSDVDVAPLRLVADAFLAGKRTETVPFED